MAQGRANRMRILAFIFCLICAALGHAHAQERVPEAEASTLAERVAQVRAEFESQRDAMHAAMEKAEDEREQNAIFARMNPNEAEFARRMVELALTAPKDPASRNALVWVIDKPYMSDGGPYGDEYARAAALLVRHFGDDPEAIRVGLELDNVFSPRRDTLLYGFLASAKGREAKGLARLGLAKYLERKAQYAAGTRKLEGRMKYRYKTVDENGAPVEKEVAQPDEEYAYALLLRLCDPDAMRAEAERLFEEVASDYGDIPFAKIRHRALEAVLHDPGANWNGRPLTEEERRQAQRILEGLGTLADVANAHLDDMRNLAVGKPAPEIDGVDFDGKPLKLSDYRGKVVALVFWGTWCGPCMREVPHERALVERLKGKPFALLGINCDEDAETARKVMASEGITWPNWHDGAPDEGPIARRYHVQGYPTIVVLDAKGIIRSKNAIGGSLDKLVDVLLEELAADGDG
jgi:thiol-disulfide isomerase/thioredoxin